MGKILEAELIIKGSDKTAPAFAGVVRHAEELKRALAGVDRAGASAGQYAQRVSAIKKSTAALNAELRAVNAVNRAFELGNGAVNRRAALINNMRRRFDGMLAGMGGVGWMVGGYAAGRVARATATDAAQFEHQRAMLAGTTGMSADDVARAVATAQKMRVPTMSATENLKAIGELRMVFVSTAEAIENVAAVQRAAAIMKAVNPERAADAEAYDMARALELKGVSMDPAHFKRLADGMVQAINASRGKITGESFFEFTQYARGASRNLSDDFYTRVAPSIIQEMRPTSAGRAISSLYEQVVGGKMKLQAATEWMKLGLLDPHKVDLNKIGNVKRINPGAFVDGALFVRDPYAWIQGYLAPALKKHGITDPARVSEELAHLFSNMYAEQLAGILLTQKTRIEKDWGLNAQAPGIAALDTLRGTDPLAATRDLAAALNSLLAAAGSPLAAAAIAAMNKMADGIRNVASGYADLAKRTPWLAAGVSTAAATGLGYVGLKGFQATWGLLTGSTALKGSAVALNASAAALDAAAVRLGVGTMAGVAGGAGGVAAAGATAGLSRFLWWIPWVGAAYSIASTPDVMQRAPGGGTWPEAIEHYRATHPHVASSPPGIADYNSPFGDFIRQRSGVAELKGDAQIHQRLEVVTSPLFEAHLHTLIDNRIHGVVINGAPPSGTAGSTGPSMPEAQPAAGGAW